MIERWQDVALCKGQEEIFFAGDLGSINYIEAGKYCNLCQVSAYCRASSLFETHGFWAGIPSTERALVRSAMNYELERDAHLVPEMARAADRAYEAGEDPEPRLAEVIGESNARHLMALRGQELKIA